ncbi:MAG TPA: FG-GAP-like repeat-containing protein [Gaiellaceae bacterium]|nr:FG-GAP-like repeat-containing protein [Gaiellaceae bacterium]
MAAVAIRGTTYPVVLPKLRDPRLHLAATITSLQVLGQIAFHFRLSIVQILLCLGTTAVLELAITIPRQRVIMWPASALLTGNGVAFVLRVPGTPHGDWWSFRGWWIFVGTAAAALLSKHVVKWRGEHLFNPSNIGLVVCFLALGRSRVEPLDFWWGPMSWWMVLALAIIVTGGLAILSRLALLRVAVGYWCAFAAAIGVLALSGHTMTARWHLGPITGFSFWWVLVTSPEVLVFLFFMITDPKTAPRDGRGRLVYAVVLGVLSGALIAPTTTEFAAKVALLSSLAVVCAVKPFLRYVPRRALVVAAAPALALTLGVMVLGNGPGPSYAATPALTGTLPPIEILPSPGVQTQLDTRTAETIAHELFAATPLPASGGAKLLLHLEPGSDQSPPTAVAQLAGATYRLHQDANGVWTLANRGTPSPRPQTVPTSDALASTRLTNVASSVGLGFRQGSFRFGVTNDVESMMGGGVCFLDYNNDGWQDLFAVNSYSSADTARWESHGGLPTTALFENDHGTFVNVSKKTGAGIAVQGDGCAAADLDGDGRTDLVVTTTQGVLVLWNRGGRFEQQVLKGSGWYTGVTVADVNGDGRPDIFAAGYSDPSEPVPGSLAGFPTNLEGVRDLLFLNEGGGRFREVGVQAGLESSSFRHGLGAEFVDVNGDGRPDLYVANDEDPNELYVNVPWPGGAAADPEKLGFRFEERAAAAGVADPFAGMGIATDDGPNGLQLFVTNSRNEQAAAYVQRRNGTFANARPDLDPALGTDFAGWGASWVDLTNSGSPDLVLTAGAIPVTSLARDAEDVRVLAPRAQPGRYGNAKNILGAGVRVNGRGLAAADVDNDGRMQIAVNTIGGKLVLLRPSGPRGNWLDVALSRFAPGAVVTATLPNGRKLTQTVLAGSSYLSSEDPRAHFGLGAATRVRSLVVRYPWGAVSRIGATRANRIVGVTVPPFKARAVAALSKARVANCTPQRMHGSAASAWDGAATASLTVGGEPAPVQARDLYDLALVMRAAVAAHTADPATTVSYAAYRLLVWRASFGANLARSFALLTRQLRAACGTPSFTSVSGSSPAAVGNRLGAATIAAGRRDGSNEDVRYADPAYTPQNGPLVVAQPGSTVHDATFWQPLALSQVSPRGSSPVPAKVQAFVGSQWGRVRTFALPAKGVAAGAPPFGIPSSAAYKEAALGVIRATAGPARTTVDSSPVAWNVRARSVAPTSLAADVRLYVTLNGALNDAAVATYRAKRAYQGPRPISMIRYLAFSGQSSDRKQASYNRDGLPLVAGLTRLANGRVEIRWRGSWIPGARWSPSVVTPPSPGWVSAPSAFAAAASVVLRHLTGHAFAATAEAAESSGLDAGIETKPDETAGRALGVLIAGLALAKR